MAVEYGTPQFFVTFTGTFDRVAESTGAMICVWRAHIEGQAGAKELLAVSPGSRAHLCLGSMAAIACSTRSGSPALGQKHFCRLFFFARESGQFQIWATNALSNTS